MGIQFHLEIDESTINLWLNTTKEDISNTHVQNVKDEIPKYLTMIEGNMMNFYKNLKKEGGIYYSNKEKQYAQTIFNTLINPQDILGDQQTIKDYVFSHGYGSTDVGDVSWNVPTGGLRVATWVPGTSAHSWQAVAAGGSSIGLKGMKLAANVLFETSKELFQNSRIIEQAQDELKEKVGPNFEYYPLLGERAPPLNYRDK